MAGAGGREVERLAVKVVPDTGGFTARLQAFLERVESTAEVTVAVKPDTAAAKAQLDALTRDLKVGLKVSIENALEVRRQLAALVRDRTARLHVDVDTTFVKAKLADLARNRALSVRVDLDLELARARLAVFLRPRTLRVRVDMDRDTFGQAFQGMQQMVGMLGRASQIMFSMGQQMGNMFGQAFSMGTQGAKQFGKALGPLKIIIGVVLVAAVLVLIGALAGLVIMAGAIIGALLAVVPVVALVGAGVFALLKSGSKEAKAFRDSLNSIKKTASNVLGVAVRPMARAIAAQMPVIDKWIGRLGGPLEQAFSAASGYVDELTQALMNFGDNLLSGIVRALQNPQMQQAINGFKKFIGDLGTALGQMFATLANGGNDYGKTFAALGQSFKILLPALAELMNAMAGEAPGLIRAFTVAMKLLMDVFKDETAMKAISAFAKISFGIIFATIATLVADLKRVYIQWKLAYDAIAWTVAKITELWNKCTSWVARSWDEMKQKASQSASSMRSTVVGHWNGLVSEAQNALNRLLGWLSGLWSRITGKNRSGATNAKSAAVGPFNGLSSAIQGAMNRVVSVVDGAWSAISGIVSRITSAIGSAISKASGLKGLLDKIPFFAPVPEAEEEVNSTFKSGDSSLGNSPTSFKAISAFDSVDRLSRLSAGLSTKFKSATGTSPDVSTNADSPAARIYNFTTYAAPNEPTEKQFVKWMSYADSLYAA